ncbi:hypothetical protein AVEN_219814-1 [Araneus ventricosus]|uniref:Uncharacterized protein n=1 Tax=Araneus ventricosus TaxID=182803 RepID=A0A4Y2UT58_ARAVE|nr:hypothetical protein AVEN_219814-1 [Araneus ventricosus]
MVASGVMPVRVVVIFLKVADSHVHPLFPANVLVHDDGGGCSVSNVTTASGVAKDSMTYENAPKVIKIEKWHEMNQTKRDAGLSCKIICPPRNPFTEQKSVEKATLSSLSRRVMG